MEAARPPAGATTRARQRLHQAQLEVRALELDEEARAADASLRAAVSALDVAQTAAERIDGSYEAAQGRDGRNGIEDDAEVWRQSITLTRQWSGASRE